MDWMNNNKVRANKKNVALLLEAMCSIENNAADNGAHHSTKDDGQSYSTCVFSVLLNEFDWF